VIDQFTPELVEQAAMKRIRPLIASHGIASPQVLAAVERWGGILDEAMHPDGKCLHCGWDVSWDPSNNRYFHARQDYSAIHCRTHAGAVATLSVLKKEYR
jgi:hypothetical protein